MRTQKTIGVVHKKGDEEAYCRACGDRFTTYPCYIKDGRGKYCSKECGYGALRKSPKGTKICSKCKEVKPHEEFYKNRTKFDGFTTECKICVKQQSLERSQLKRKQIIHEMGLECAICKTQNPDYRFFDLDHIIPLSKLADSKRHYDYKDRGNLQVLCPNCHRGKTMQDMGWRAL